MVGCRNHSTKRDRYCVQECYVSHVYFIHFAGSVNPVQKTRLVTFSELLNYFQTVDLSQQAVRKKRRRYFS